MNKTRFLPVFSILIFLFFLFSISYLVLGDKNYSLTQLLSNTVILQLRFPRLIAIVFVGILLSTSGLLVQLMTRNPIAELSTLGISGGASLALSILLVLGSSTSDWTSLAGAVLGAFFALLVVMLFTARSRFQPLKVVLVGTSVGLFSTSLASSLSFYSQNTQAYFLWIVGSFSGITNLKVQILAVTTIIFLSFTLLFSKSIRLLSFGEEMATSLGVNVNGVRLLIMGLVALASGVSVATVGVIAFVGLIAPHIARVYERKSFYKLLLLSALIAVDGLILADLLARNLFKPFEFPAGSLTMLCGAPFFIYLMTRKEHMR